MGQPLDSLDIWGATRGLAEQVEAAASSAAEVTDLPKIDDIDHVVMMGMGGSGIAGDVVRAVAGPHMPIPVVVEKGYGCPPFVSSRSLVFAVSFSGDTEETLEAAGEAEQAGAHVVCVTSGGQLAELADASGLAVLPVDGSIPQPRAAIGAVSIPPLVALGAIGLWPGAQEWIALAVEQLKRRRDQLAADKNVADRLARHIGRTFPLMYGGADLGQVAALRWKGQVNENTKAPAFANALPELCHNELAGWGQSGDVTRQMLTLINLRHDFEHPQLSRRFEFTNKAVEEVVASIHEVRAEGEGRLAQLLDLTLIGDFVSLYMAAAQDVDPGPIPILNDLKAYLKL
ncbi:MAG: glucose/mannose-6-phosphate isomerase [Candidatus Poriferisodalaceae bacterium]|jgi:glucose/mannose-6-phosphate isomerase